MKKYLCIILTLISVSRLKSQDYSLDWNRQNRHTYSDTLKGKPTDTVIVDGMIFKIQVPKKYRPPFFPKVIGHKLIFTDKHKTIANMIVTDYEYSFVQADTTVRKTNLSDSLLEPIRNAKLTPGKQLTIIKYSSVNPDELSTMKLETPFYIVRIK